MNQQQRAIDLLTSQKYLSLATVLQGEPWCCNINFVAENPPEGILLFYSDKNSNHIRSLTANSRVAGTIFKVDQSGNVEDGLQFNGSVSEVDSAEVESVQEYYYRSNFPDEQERAEWTIPAERFTLENPQRFYRLHIDSLWVIDLEQWEVDKVDRRVAVEFPISFNRL